MNINARDTHQQATISGKWYTALNIVAYFIIVYCVVSLTVCVVGTFYFGRFCINFFDVLSVYAGLKLFSFSDGWRKYLLVYLWTMIVSCEFFLLYWTPATIYDSSINLTKNWSCGIVLAVMICNIGCLVVLHHPQVHKMFKRKKNP